MTKMKVYAGLLALGLLVSGCSGLSQREQRVLSGTGIGAAGGTVLAAIAGGPILVGTAIGAAAGAVGGLIVDEAKNR